jgi:MFS family permease
MPDNQKSKTLFISSNIVLLGLVSLFTDISTEMIYPILPLYLSSVMGATPTIIGIIEGIAESLASIIKLFSGIVSDTFGKKKLLAFFGYASSILSKIVIFLSVTWSGVLVARIIDRFGKGIRTAPRDALIAESAEKDGLGKAYGLHKALDTLGAAIGILLAFMLITAETNAYKRLFLFSLIPAFIGVLIIFFIKDTEKRIEKKQLTFRWKYLDKRLKLFIICIFIFTLGNSSNAFILLRAYNAGFSSREAILLYFVYNIVASILSFPLGKLSDKIGRKNTLCIGYFLYGIVYFGIGLLTHKILFWCLFALYGVFTALTAGGERALIAQIAPESQKASALGLHAAIVGLGLLPASIIAGVLWDTIGQTAPFIFGGVLAFFTSIGVYIILRKGQDSL